MLSRNYFTFPFYLPRIYRLWTNWPEYLVNYVLRRNTPAEYRTRDGLEFLDGVGDLPGTLAVVFLRREYGSVDRFLTIVDVGANMGSFAVYAAASCPDARIICFEPELLNFSILMQNLHRNGLHSRVSAYQCAIASAAGQRELALAESLRHSFFMPTEYGEQQSVDCMTLREVIDDHQLDTIDLLKMNCEGAEYEILEGCAPDDLARVGNIRLEYHNLDPTRRNGESLSKLLMRRGYKIDRFTRYMNTSGFIWATRTMFSWKLVSSVFQDFIVLA